MDGTGYGDPITDPWNLPDASNRPEGSVNSNWDLADRPAKPMHAASFADVLHGIGAIIADGPNAKRGGTREPAATSKVERLRAMPYSEYLLTMAWAVKREEKIAEAGLSCQRCGLKYGDLKAEGRLPLNVHHLTYVRLGDELLSDLAVVCRLCHRQLHNPGEADQGEGV